MCSGSWVGRLVVGELFECIFIFLGDIDRDGLDSFKFGCVLKLLKIV